MNRMTVDHRKAGRFGALAGVLAVGLLSMAGAAIAAPGQFRECAGRIEEAGSGHVIAFHDLADRVARVDLVLFGERHGVREQAVASSCILSAMAQGERPVTVVLEMLSRDDDKIIERYRQDHPESAAGLGVELKWWDRGWPAFDNWLPLVERAFSLRASLRGGDLPEKVARPDKLTLQENKALSKRLGSAEAAIRDSWRKAMVAAHCGLLSQAQAEINAGHQIRRDFSMADSAADARAANHRVLMQVGRGHSRKDRSLYRALSDANGPVLTIGAFTDGEVIGAEERRLYDYLWIVGTADLSDPCKFTGAMHKAGELASQ